MKYVLIGTGNISNTYISAVQAISGAEIIACISRNLKTPRTAGSLPSYKNLEEIDISFDAVIITTPNGLHHVSAVQAAKMNKHVLCEKPLDISVKSMNIMIAACNKAEVTLGVAYQRRTSPHNLAIKKLIEIKALKRIYSVDLSCKFWRTPDYYNSGDYRGDYQIDGGGPFIQQACHNLDLYQWLFGMPIEVKGMLGNLYHDIEAEDHGAALFRHSDGMIGTIVASTLSKPGMPARMEVVTEAGYFVTLDDSITEWNIHGVEDPRKSENSMENKKKSFEENKPFVSDSSRHESIIRDFESAVFEGRDPLVTGESAKKTTELILQIYKNTVVRKRVE